MNKYARHRLPIRLFLAVLCGISLITTAMPSASHADDPEGIWKLRVSYEGREGRQSILKLHRDGEQLKGVLVDYQGPETSLENVTFENGQLSFEVPRIRDGRRSTLRYVGKVEGDAMRGTADRERRERTATISWAATRTSSEEESKVLGPPPVAADIELNDQNYADWRDHILPNSSEMAWEQIPWLTTFKDGILAADSAGKPLLLWTMNGHPLGCT